MTKAIKVEFSCYTHFLVSPEDAATLLAIAMRSIHVTRERHDEPYRQAGDNLLFMDGVEVVDYEPLALPVEKSETPF